MGTGADMDIEQLTILTILLSEAWRKLAARHRLHFDPGRRVVQKTSVSGSLRGREFSLTGVGGNKNHGSVHMELTLRGSLPVGLELHPVDENIAQLAAVTGIPVDALAGGEAQVNIDDQLRAKAADSEEVPVYLTPQRTKAALQLAEIGGSLEDHKLRVPVDKTATDLEQLDRTLRTLRRIAPVLETA
jgi:hypothetical protein